MSGVPGESASNLEDLLQGLAALAEDTSAVAMQPGYPRAANRSGPEHPEPASDDAPRWMPGRGDELAGQPVAETAAIVDTFVPTRREAWKTPTSGRPKLPPSCSA